MSLLESVSSKRPVVAVIGGAVSGSEAAARLARRGAIVAVIEQNRRPYGKIEDGLPRWHEKLRDQEYEKVDANLKTPNVHFVPSTALGRDVTIEQLVDEIGFSAVVLANGAWRDRPLPVPGIENYLDRGFAYQNSFVYWFNHAHEAGYAGKRYEIPNSAVVIGGGLASVDVAKVVNLELYRSALARRGVEIDAVALETAGIAETLAKHGIDAASLGIEGATLYYRRRKQDMPLAQAGSDDPKALAKAEVARVKIMERVERKYLVRFVELASPTEAIVEGDRVVGMRFVRNEVSGNGVRAIAGSEFEARAGLVVSSIGSIPLPLPGVAMRGELYDFEDQATGRLRGQKRVFGLGNVLTGRGNIRDSRENAVAITDYIAASFLGVSDSPEHEREMSPTPLVSDATLEAAIAPELWVSPEQIRHVGRFIEERWAKVGYQGDYDRYVHGR